METGAILMASGVACLVLSILIIRKVMPQEGKPQSAWTSTEMRSSALAIGLLVMMIAGVLLIIKGFGGLT